MAGRLAAGPSDIGQVLCICARRPRTREEMKDMFRAMRRAGVPIDGGAVAQLERIERELPSLLNEGLRNDWLVTGRLTVRRPLTTD
jgi:hypothetical protein